MPFTVYVLRNPDGRLYVGHTSDLQRRLTEHRDGLSRWTTNRGPWELVHAETFGTRADAMKREKALKSGRRNSQLRELIERHRVPPGC